MKKTFKFVAIALATVAMMAACKNAPEATEDTVADTMEVIDTMPVVDSIAEEPVVEETPAPAAKKPAAKKTTPATPAVTKEQTEGGRTIGKINTTEEKTTVKEEAIKGGKLVRK